MTGHEDPALAGAALEKLYKVYRGPIYMEPALLREDAKDLYAPWAAALAMSQEAVEVAFHRLRRRFGKALRHEVEQTVPDPADAKEELICLLAATVD
jgi:uroporphyrinogen-III synthase